jgi:protein-histidine pros-kinase
LTDRIDGSEFTPATFQALLEAAPDAVVVVDEAGVIQLVNRQTEVMFGYSRDELLGEQVEHLVPMRAREGHPSWRDAYMKNPTTRPMGAGLALTALRKDGSELSVDIALSPLRTDGRLLVSAAIRDTTDRQRVQEMLRQAAQEAERANAAKSEFLSRMSHELRTPLAAILGFAELLHLHRVGPDQAEMFVERILRAGHHLLELINDVLDISRVESGTLSVSIEPVNLAALVADTVEIVQPMAQSADVTVRVDLGPVDGIVFADMNRLKQVLLNLLSNAVKYNHSGGEVTIGWEVQSTPHVVRVNVRDTGPGIAQEHLDRLFRPFERLGAEASGVEGTGIGLALSKRLVELMHGSLGFETSVGSGSTFWVELPLAPAVPSTGRVDAEGSLEPAQLDRTVLYVEDNLSNYMVVEGVLELRPGVRLLTALQGRLGFELARQHRPDLILLDLNLPDVPGDQVLAMLRSDPATASIPVVVISADAMPDRIKELLGSGARAYLTKPISVRVFLKVLDDLLLPR